MREFRELISDIFSNNYDSEGDECKLNLLKD